MKTPLTKTKKEMTYGGNFSNYMTKGSKDPQYIKSDCSQ